ncbi:MAG: OmpH family outer membrane protein [Candidatus Omnitrophica bacterium]|nr:OmpH family outer membrane protein [Candidatus Omnitrophota bacterium]
MFRKLVSVLILVLFCATLCANVFAEDQKVGLINFRKAGFECKKGKTFQKEFEEKDKKAKEELDEMAKELRKLRDEADLLSDKAKAKKEEELMKKQVAFNDSRRKKSEEILRWRDDKMREITKDITDATSAYAKNNGYDMILDQMVSVYYTDKYDITDEIMKELNK